MENLKRINDAQLKILQDNKTMLKRKNEAAVELDRKIEVKIISQYKLYFGNDFLKNYNFCVIFVVLNFKDFIV